MRRISGKLKSVGQMASPVFVAALAMTVGALCMAIVVAGGQGHAPLGDGQGTFGQDGMSLAASLTTSAQGKANVSPGNSVTLLTLSNPSLKLIYSCPSDLTTNAALTLKNTGSGSLKVFSDRAASQVQFVSLAPGGTHTRSPEPSGDHVSFQAQGQAMATIEAFSVNRTGDCHVQAQALLTS